jgi:hypothetical protein
VRKVKCTTSLDARFCQWSELILLPSSFRVRRVLSYPLRTNLRSRSISSERPRLKCLQTIPRAWTSASIYFRQHSKVEIRSTNSFFYAPLKEGKIDMTLHLSPEELIARHKAQQKAWRLAHPERVQEYHLRHQNSEEGKARRKDWTQRNRERINERRRAIYAEGKANRAETHPEAVSCN